jgi:WD40 repeat protein
MTFSVDRKRLVSGSSDGSVRIWNSGYEGSGELSGLSDLRVLREHEDSIESLAFSPDGELFASLDRKGILKIWSSKGELKSTSRVSLGYKSILHFSDTELLFASVDNDNSIRIGSNQQDWGCCLRGYKFLLKGHRTLLRVMCFSPNKGTLASADQDGTIRIWDCNRDVRSTVVGCHKGVYQLRFSPDGKLLASAGAGGDINIWAVT